MKVGGKRWKLEVRTDIEVVSSFSMSNAKSKVGIPARPVDGVAAQLQLHWKAETKHQSSSCSSPLERRGQINIQVIVAAAQPATTTLGGGKETSEQ